AAGDVVGLPALAATSMEQGRLAACHAFHVEQSTLPKVLPYGIYTIPEISTVGKTEEDLTKEGVPYEIGRAFYKEIARGQIVGDLEGLLKLIFHRTTLELLGVHIIGDGATELVHIGQAVLTYGGKVGFLVQNVFNYPTLAERYRPPALEAIFPDDYDGDQDGQMWVREWEQRLKPEIVKLVFDHLRQQPAWKVHVRNRGASPQDEIEIAMVKEF